MEAEWESGAVLAGLGQAELGRGRIRARFEVCERALQQGYTQGSRVSAKSRENSVATVRRLIDRGSHVLVTRLGPSQHLAERVLRLTRHT